MLDVQAINQYYGGSHTLRGVSLDVKQGECLALLGRNGVGKTTLLKCLMGVLPLASGKVMSRRPGIFPAVAAPARGHAVWPTCRRAAISSPA